MTTFIGIATDTQITDWKRQNPSGIYALVIDGHIAYFKNPNRHELNCAMSKMDKDQTLAVFESLAELTFLGGSELLLTDDQMFLGVCQQLKHKFEGKKAQLVNI